MDEITVLKNEIKKLRGEVAENKKLLLSISSAITSALAVRPELVLSSRPDLEINCRDQYPSQQEVAAAQARGDLSLLHAQNKRRLQAFKKKKSK